MTDRETGDWRPEAALREPQGPEQRRGGETVSTAKEKEALRPGSGQAKDGVSGTTENDGTETEAAENKAYDDGLPHFICTEYGCGRVFGTEHGLRRHMSVHKTKEKKAHAKKTRKPRAGPPADRRAGGGFQEVFEGVAAQITRVGTILDQCVTGLDTLVTAARDLRKKYIANTSKLKKLQRATEMGFDAREDGE